MRTVPTRLIAAAIALPTLGGITLVASAPATATLVSATPVAADIADLKEKVSSLENKVADLAEKADKANSKLDKADASLKKAKNVLAKVKKRQKRAVKKLARAESDADTARHDLGLVRFGANMARNIEFRAGDVEAQQADDDHGLIDVSTVSNDVDAEPVLADISAEAAAAERTVTFSAIQAGWAGAAAHADLREATQAVKRATAKRDEAGKAHKKVRGAANKANNKLGKVESRLEKVDHKLDKAVEKRRAAERKEAAERKRAAEQDARAAANRIARPGTGHVTSAYGMRVHPITGVYKLHSGTDFSYGDGRAYAARSGTVAAVTYDGAYGNMVTLSHGSGLQTRYAHLAAPNVSAGQNVSAGDVVGQIGSTGYATGAHLHFEVLEGGEFVNSDTWLGR